MIDKQTKNQIIKNLFKLLSDCNRHKVIEKDLMNNYESKKHRQIIKLIIQDLINKGYIKSVSGSNNVFLKIDTLGLEVLEAGSWTNYNNQLINDLKSINYTNYEKVGAVYHGDVTAENVKAEIKESTNNIGGDNLVTQSSESDFKSPIIQNNNKKIAENKPSNSFLQRLYWIIGIIVSLILIYKFIEPML